MLHFKAFECETDAVLMQELSPLIIFVESHSTKLNTPPRSVVFLGCLPGTLGVRVMNNRLVVVCFTEVPNELFVQTMINKWNVGVRRVRVQILTLGVCSKEFLVSILSGNEGRGADNTFFLWHERLHTLDVVCLVQRDIIVVAVVVRVIREVLVHTSEGVIDDELVVLGVNKSLEGNSNTRVKHESTISSMLMVIIESEIIFGATKALLLPV